MRTIARTLSLALATVVVATGCTSDSDGPGTSRPIGNEPLADNEVTLHLQDPPELPPSLSGAEITTSELRAEDLTERHTIELVDVPAGTTGVEGPLAPGALLRVLSGQQLEVGATADVAVIDPDASDEVAAVVQEVLASCTAPCMVEGPALVSSDGWMAGFGVAPGWHLLVPSPIGD